MYALHTSTQMAHQEDYLQKGVENKAVDVSRLNKENSKLCQIKIATPQRQK